MARKILDALDGMTGGRSVGKMHSDLCPRGELTRDAFEEVMGALARSALVKLTEAVFEKDGKQIPFRKATRTRDSDFVEEDASLGLQIKEVAPVAKLRRKKRAATGAGRKRERTPLAPPAPSGRAEEMLRAWRLSLAKRQAVPAFRIMSDKVLTTIAEKKPRTAAQLLAIPGIGIQSVEKYGAQIYRILNESQAG